MRKLLTSILWLATICCSLISAPAALAQIDYGSPKSYTIAEVDVEGAFYNDKLSLISISGFEVGEKITLPGDDITKAIRKLWKLGIIGDITIRADKLPEDKVKLVIELKERPRLTRYTLEGISSSNSTTLTDKINLTRGRIVTDAMIKNAKKSVSNYYAEKGFNNVQIAVQQKPDTLVNNGVELIFEVDKGERTRIEEIVFEGVAEVDPKKLRKKMKKTKQKRFGRIFTPSKFVREEYRNDKKKHYQLLQYARLPRCTHCFRPGRTAR